MWAKYKFYILAAILVLLAFVLYKKYGKGKTVIDDASEDPGSKILNSGNSTVADQTALSRALNYVK